MYSSFAGEIASALGKLRSAATVVIIPARVDPADAVVPRIGDIDIPDRVRLHVHRSIQAAPAPRPLRRRKTLACPVPAIVVMSRPSRPCGRDGCRYPRCTDSPRGPRDARGLGKVGGRRGTPIAVESREPGARHRRQLPSAPNLPTRLLCSSAKYRTRRSPAPARSASPSATKWPDPGA